MKIESRKRILIIVHGAWPLKFKNTFLEKARKVIGSQLTSERGILRADYKELSKIFSKDYDSVKFLRWNGGIIKGKDIMPATRKLENMLKKNKGNYLDIIGVSMGGYIVQRALENLRDVTVNKVLYVGAVHNGLHELKNVKSAINVYSKIDKMFLLANKFYNGLGNAFLKGSSVVNISLPEIKHQDLCKNTRLTKGPAKGFLLFDLYKNLLKNDNFGFLKSI